MFVKIKQQMFLDWKAFHNSIHLGILIFLALSAKVFSIFLLESLFGTYFIGGKFMHNILKWVHYYSGYISCILPFFILEVS